MAAQEAKKPERVRTLAEGVSTGWEKERTFAAEDVMAALKELGVESEGLDITSRLLSHDGTLLAMHMRAPGKAEGLSYTLKGQHGRGCGSLVTFIESVEYLGADSDDVIFSQILAEFDGETWVKS